MSLSIQMRFDEAKALFDSMQFAANPMVTISFDDDNLDIVQQLRRQQALNAMKSFRGSGMGGLLDELLQERQEDRKKDW